MNLTNEQFQAIQNCKSAKEIIAKGNEFGVSISQEEAKEYLDKFSFAEIDDDDIEKVAGGCFTTTRACNMCHTDISHSPFYRHEYTGHEYCITCAGNSGMIGNNDYYYVAND